MGGKESTVDAGVAKIYIVGAGPGDPSLITVKGWQLLQRADLVVYAGSLVNEELLEVCKPEAKLVNSHGKRLDELVDVMASGALSGELVVRLASGDPSLYGSLKEMKEELQKRGVEVEVVPGVSSLVAGAAVIKEELTVPGGPQSLVVTRLSGKTPVRPEESLERFVATGASIAVFLSADKIEEIKRRALRAGASFETPVVIVYKATWPQQKVVTTTLGELKQPDDIKGSAIVYILPGMNLEGKRSYLYGSEYRKGKKVYEDEFALIKVSKVDDVPKRLFEVFKKAVLVQDGSLKERVERAWGIGKPVVFVAPVGVVVRVIAPLLRDKRIDPPVIAVDVAGSFVVVVSGGHQGGNSLAKKIASVLGAVPVITTGTEVLGRVSLEELLAERDLELLGGSAKRFNVLSVEGRPIFSVGMGWRKEVSPEDFREALQSIWEKVDRDQVAVFACAAFKAKEATDIEGPLLPSGVALVGVPEEVLVKFAGVSPSRAMDLLGIPGVCEPCALSVLPRGELVVPKVVVGKVTFSVARYAGG